MKWLLLMNGLLFLVFATINYMKGIDATIYIGFAITFIGIGHILHKIEKLQK